MHRMAASDRARSHALRRLRRWLSDYGIEILEARLGAGVSQEELGRTVGMSGTKVSRIEHGKLFSLTLSDAAQLAAALGFDLSLRLYPGGDAVRDAGQAKRLNQLLGHLVPPLTFRLEVPLPQRPGQPTELRAWDAMIMGAGERTGVELESRIRDIQATARRHALKRRDDPVDRFLLVLADTRSNRRIADEYGALNRDLPRLRTAAVLGSLELGQHPPTGMIFF